MVTIDTVNYFSGREYDDWNTKVLYKKCGRLYLMYIHINMLSENFSIPSKLPKECKRLKGFSEAMENWLIENYKFRFFAFGGTKYPRTK